VSGPVGFCNRRESIYSNRQIRSADSAGSGKIGGNVKETGLFGCYFS
jgi:hypothetical protein